MDAAKGLKGEDQMVSTSRRRTTGKTCKYWNCKERVRYDYCTEHYRDLKAGKIDECPGCGRAKDAKYPTCLDCKDKPRSAVKEAVKGVVRGAVKGAIEGAAKSATRSESGGKPRARYDRYREEHSDAWSAGDADASEFYVYVLKLNDGTFYAGQTREIRERLMEHRDGTTRTTVGKDPKLVWFSTVSTRKQATELEVIVKKVCDRNPREIRRWILKFQDLVDELDFS